MLQKISEKLGFADPDSLVVLLIVCAVFVACIIFGSPATELSIDQWPMIN